MYTEDAGEAVRLCEALLEEPELDPAVRIGDAFGFLVEHHCQQGNFQVVTIIFLTFFNRSNKTLVKEYVCILLKKVIKSSDKHLSLYLHSLCLLQAYRKLEELQKLLPSQNVRYYVSQASLEALQKEIGIPMERGERRQSLKGEDEVEEDLNVS